MDWKVPFKKYNVWTIVLAVVGAGIFWKLYKPGLRFSQLGDWSWENWLWLLAFWGVLTALIAFNEKSLGSWAKTLQSTVAAAMFIMFLGIPSWFWVAGIFSPSQQTQQLARPMLKMPPNGDSERISPDAGQVVIFTGDGFEHHVVYADGNDCIVGNPASPCKDGPILYQYVRDTTGKSNSVSYKLMR
ncbi:MAG: hypothetical protein AAB555_02650 [Patescibacteria group bacterium]